MLILLLIVVSEYNISAKRKKLTIAIGKKLIENFKKSNLTKSAFATIHGIVKATLKRTNLLYRRCDQCKEIASKRFNI